MRSIRWRLTLAYGLALAATIVFYLLASSVRGRLVEAQMTPIRAQREAVLHQIAASLGDAGHAREEAERIMWLDEHASPIYNLICSADSQVTRAQELEIIGERLIMNF